MKYFSIAEMCRSNVARQYGINNTPNQEQIDNLTLLINKVLDPLRQAYGKPIYVTSGFRSQALNAHPKIKGATYSQHLYGQAADIVVYAKDANGNNVVSKEENKKLFDLAQELRLPFDQLIDEYNFKWVHISYSKSRCRQQVIHKR